MSTLIYVDYMERDNWVDDNKPGLLLEFDSIGSNIIPIAVNFGGVIIYNEGNSYISLNVGGGKRVRIKQSELIIGYRFFYDTLNFAKPSDFYKKKHNKLDFEFFELVINDKSIGGKRILSGLEISIKINLVHTFKSGESTLDLDKMICDWNYLNFISTNFENYAREIIREL